MGLPIVSCGPSLTPKQQTKRTRWRACTRILRITRQSSFLIVGWTEGFCSGWAGVAEPTRPLTFGDHVEQELSVRNRPPHGLYGCRYSLARGGSWMITH